MKTLFLVDTPNGEELYLLNEQGILSNETVGCRVSKIGRIETTETVKEFFDIYYPCKIIEIVERI